MTSSQDKKLPFQETLRWSKITSLRAGKGEVLVCRPKTSDDLSALLQAQVAGQIPPLHPLGAGTNMLGYDDNQQLAMVRLAADGQFAAVEQLGNGLFRIGAAALLGRTLEKLASDCYGGCAGLSGIPGTVGGALAMNAGANGQEIAEAVRSLEGLDLATGQPWAWQVGQGGWGYRQSPVPRQVLLTSAVLEFQAVSPQEEEGRIRQEWQRRQRVTPRGASAGSVFRNPPENSAGRLLEQTGCKGLQTGIYCVSQQHANWIVNETYGEGLAEDCLILLREMRRRVQESCGILLQPEWRRPAR